MSTVAGPDAGGGSPGPVTSPGAGEPGGSGAGKGQAGGGDQHRPARRGPRAGMLLALAAGALAAAAGLAAVVMYWPRPPRPPAHPLHALRGTVFRLRPGHCVNTAPDGIDHARALPCAQPHDAEIYATYRLAEQHWPGTAVIGRQARQGCRPKLGAYINPQLSTAGLALSYAYPDQGAWDLGERTVICEVRSTKGKLTGSVRAYGR